MPSVQRGPQGRHAAHAAQRVTRGLGARLVPGKRGGGGRRARVRHAQLGQARLQAAVLAARAVHRQEHDRARVARGLRPEPHIGVPAGRGRLRRGGLRANLGKSCNAGLRMCAPASSSRHNGLRRRLLNCFF